jgi:hypothetical protein
MHPSTSRGPGAIPHSVENDVPQLQVFSAFGLSMVNPD